MKVVEWISYDDADESKCSVGGTGGWFGRDGNHRWNDYIEIWTDEVKCYLEAIREDVIKNKIRYSGNQHQNNGSGVPVFDDGTIGTFSQRGWADLMAAIWAEEENVNYNYVAFYF